jgi:glutamate 5-kinase
MSRYDELFAAAGCKVGQILMTHADFKHTMRLTNARRTMENLVRNRVIPIINENDVVADEEIKADLAFGDNDFLAALVVKLIRADLLVMLTTTDGVRKTSKSNRTERLRYIENITRSHLQLARTPKPGLSKGGMVSKLKAAQTASRAGCSVVIAKGRQPGVLTGIMNGEDVGTMILAEGI